MPWVRIDENALEHPKIATLTDGAFRLWVQGLAYCQKYLTDGYISDVALRALRSYSPKRRGGLLTAGLWETSETGIRVHDFLQWNDSREHVMAVRALAKERLRKHREKRVANSVGNGGGNAHVSVGGVREAPQASEVREGGSGETKAPPPAKVAYDGSRLKVWRWQHEDLARRLGDRSFDLLGWYPKLDAELAASGESYADPWKFLQERLYRDADLPLPNLFGRSKTAGNIAAGQRFAARGES